MSGDNDVIGTFHRVGEGLYNLIRLCWKSTADLW